MRITRSTLRRLIAEESARLLREAAEEEESTAMDEAERGKKGHADCLYVLYGGRGVYYYTAPCGLSEEEAAEQGHDVSADVADGEDMADPLSLYDWLQRHDEITAVYDDESAGGEVSKDDFMEQLRGVGEEEGLFADDEFINEDDETLDETEDQHYNDDLQSRLGHFTTPENVKGTPQHKEKHAPPAGGGRGGSGYVSRRSEWGDADLYGGPPRVDEGRDADVDCLYILKRSGQHVYIVARPYIESAEELAETGNDITDMIMAQGPAARNSNVYEFLSSNPQVAVVRVRGAYEMADDYMMELEDSMDFSTGPVYEGAFPEELEGVYGEEPPEFDEESHSDDSFMDYDPEEIPDMDDQYDPEYYEGLDDEEDAEDFMDYETGDDDVPYGAADVALRMGRGHRTDESKGHAKVTPRKRLGAWLDKAGVDSGTVMSAIDKALEYAHEETGEKPDSEDVTFNLSDDVLDALPEDEDDKWHSMIDAVLKDEFDADAFADAEAYRKDIEDTERDLSHPSRFLEEGDDDSQGDDDFSVGGDDDYEHAYAMGGGSDEEGFAIDYDVGRPSPFAAKMFGQPTAGADDIEGADADEDVWGDDDMGRSGARDDYHHAYKLGGGRDEEGFAADYDTGKKRQFPPARGGINEARWAKLAGIMKG